MSQQCAHMQILVDFWEGSTLRMARFTDSYRWSDTNARDASAPVKSEYTDTI